MVFNRAGKETYFFLFQPRKGKAHESPFQEVLPKLATLRKKVQRDLLKFLCVRCRYLLQNYRAGAHQETFRCAKAACSRAQWGLCHCDFFVFVRNIRKEKLFTSVFVFQNTTLQENCGLSYFLKQLQDSYSTPSHSQLCTALHFSL